MEDDRDSGSRSSETEELLSKLELDNRVFRQDAEKTLTDGPHIISAKKKKTQILMDDADEDDSPLMKPFQPIEVVVRHNNVVEQDKSDSDDDTDVEMGKRSKVLNEDTESPMNDPSSSNIADVKNSPSWTRGHSRARSFPNEKEEGNHHSRRVVKYRQERLRAGSAAVNEKDAHARNVVWDEPFQITILNPENDDNELEIEINEGEVEVPGEEERNARHRVKRFWEARWKTTNFEGLPKWLQDNEYLRSGYRPPIPSFINCFKSIFDLHTETGNIITHMYGCVAFIGITFWFLTRSSVQVQLMEKLIFSTFFLGTISCLAMSFIFHTMSCHSDAIGRIFSKLDYTGITLSMLGSFIPWIYYAFNCRPQSMIIYLTMISILGIIAFVVSLWNKFAGPSYRPLRAGIFVAMGLSALIPAAHIFVVDGLDYLVYKCSLYWLIAVACLYIGGAGIYAARIPERCFPGKCDLWLQSHQLFHLCVVAACFVHFHAITRMAMQKLMEGSCPEQLLERYGSEQYFSWLGQLLGIEDSPSTGSWSPDFLVT